MIEKRCHMTWETPIKIGNPPQGRRNIVIPAWLVHPERPLRVVRISMNLQRPAFETGTDAVMVMAHDPEGAYALATGFPGVLPDWNPSVALDERGPAFDAQERLLRLWHLALTPSLERESRVDHDPPVNIWRERGDLIQIDPPGIGMGPEAENTWICWGLEYEFDTDDLQPPAKAFAIGTYGRQPVETATNPPYPVTTGRTITPSSTPMFSFDFTAPADGRITSTMFRASYVNAQGIVKARLYASGSTTPIAESREWRVNVVGDHAIPWDVAAAADVEEGNAYRIVISTDGISDPHRAGGANSLLDLWVETCGAIGGFGSRRGASLGSLSTLPNTEEWRFWIEAIGPVPA